MSSHGLPMTPHCRPVSPPLTHSPPHPLAWPSHADVPLDFLVFPMFSTPWTSNNLRYFLMDFEDTSPPTSRQFATSQSLAPSGSHSLHWIPRPRDYWMVQAVTDAKICVLDAEEFQLVCGGFIKKSKGLTFNPKQHLGDKAIIDHQSKCTRVHPR